MMDLYFYKTTDLKYEKKKDSPGTVSGYVTKWNTFSSDRGGYKDVFRKGVFRNLKQKSETDVKAYRDHDESVYLGRTNNSSLRLSEDEIGLFFSLDLPNTSDGRDTAELLARGDYVGMSFGYEKDIYQWFRDPEPFREHTSGVLLEVSIVLDPAFSNTEAILSSVSKTDETTKAELENFLQVRLNAAKRKLQLLNISAINSTGAK